MDKYIVNEYNKKVNKDLGSKTAALHNLGCKVNYYETEKIRTLLESDGYKIVDFEDVSDVYIINTCSVTSIADKKSRQMIRRARKRNPDALVVAMGCFVETLTEKEKLALAADIYIGNDKKRDIISEIRDFKSGNSHTRAFVKIQDGCNQFCSYCIIPYVRGRIKSREPSDIVEEIRALGESGYREVVLTGIHVSSFGRDIEGSYSLINLCEEIENISGIDRVRLSSLEPRIVTEEFAVRMGKLKKLCPHFHLSLQSGCDETIKRMNRHYTTADFTEAAGLLRREFSDPAVTTDVIVGFPGESDEEFGKSLDFVKSIGFADMHIFRYSMRAGTPAAKMQGQISGREKIARSEIMIEAAREMSHAYRRRHIGRSVSVLFEEKILIDNEEYYTGFTENYMRALMKSDSDICGIIKEAEVKDTLKEYVLAG